MPDANFFQTGLRFTLAELAECCGATLSASTQGEYVVSGVASIDKASATEISFLSNRKYADSAYTTTAGACIIHPKYADILPKTTVALMTDDPYVAYAKVAAKLHPVKTPAVQIAKTAAVSDTATIGKNCSIGDFVSIGRNVVIGDNVVVHAHAVIGDSVQIGHHTVIYSQVSLTHSIVGSHVIIHAGCRIGQDGFGFATEHGRHLKVPQLGRVIIEDYVDIGANSCVDRGAGPDTIIGAGTQIDNMVQVGHNVVIGRGCVIVSQSGVAGSSRLGNYVVIGGQSGIAGHLTIGDMAQVAGKSGVTKNIPKGAKYGGYPAVPIKDWHRQAIILKKQTKKAS